MKYIPCEWRETELNCYRLIVADKASIDSVFGMSYKGGGFKWWIGSDIKSDLTFDTKEEAMEYVEKMYNVVTNKSDSIILTSKPIQENKPSIISKILCFFGIHSMERIKYRIYECKRCKIQKEDFLL